jgi:CRISPR-associated DxTHG motif protein
MTTKLVCAVGTGTYKETTYRFGDVEKTTKYAPIAVGCCTAKSKEDLELVTLLTDLAEKDHGEQLKRETEDEGWPYANVRIPAGRSEEELWEIFDAFGRELKQGDELILDLTHGFRHIPALLLSATQYYTVRKSLKLLGIFYGAYDKNEKDTPIFDLTPLYDLSEWTYGVRLLRDYQFSAPLGEMLDKVQRRSHSDPRYRPSRFTKLQKVGRSLESLESPLVSGIPLEAGFEAHRALENAKASEDELARIPPMEEPWQELKQQLESFRLQGSGKKKGVRLTLEELHRQGRLIERYLESGNLWAAANLLREWMVSAVIFHSGVSENWLDYGEQRKPVENKLGALSKWNEKENAHLREALTKEQRTLVGRWNKISERRNAFAHAGMKAEMTKFDTCEFHQVFDELRQRLGVAESWSVETAGKTEDRWLISPLGTIPGALFTAIKRAKPDQLLIVTSEQGEKLVAEILRAAGRENLSPHCALLDDPFNGFSEVRQITRSLRKEYGLDWIRAGEIVVNLTGGTTCLGWAVTQLESNLKRMSLNTRTVACIDRRTPEEQRRAPYREGEMRDIHLDEDEEKNG